MTIPVLYDSIEGQTKKIAQFVAEKISESGGESVLVNIGDPASDVSFDNVDKVILAAPVHERRHPKEFEVFLAASRNELQARQTMLISVSLSAAFPESLDEAREYLIEMEMRTDFKPDVEVLAAGAVRPSGYEYFERQILRHHVLRGKDIDLDGEPHEFTDWQALGKAVTEFASS